MTLLLTVFGLIRLVVGSLLTWNMAVYGLDLRDFFGSDGFLADLRATFAKPLA